MTIGIFAPSSPLVQDEVRTYSLLDQHGINVIEHDICKQTYAGYLAGTARDRARAIHDLYLDDRVDILMAFWGGMNTNEILPFLDFELIQTNYKPTIGYSDTSALLNAISKMTGRVTYLGPSGITLLKPEPVSYSVSYLLQAIGSQKEILIQDSSHFADDEYYCRPYPGNLSREVKVNEGRIVIKNGCETGRIVAGNLQTIAVLAGTHYFPDLSNTILFLEEDSTEDAASIRRYLTQLRMQTGFDKIKGIVWGRFCNKSNVSIEDLTLIMNDCVGEFPIPVIANLDFGHSDPMFTIPIGGTAHIDTEKALVVFNQ